MDRPLKDIFSGEWEITSIYPIFKGICKINAAHKKTKEIFSTEAGHVYINRLCVDKFNTPITQMKNYHGKK